MMRYNKLIITIFLQIDSLSCCIPMLDANSTNSCPINSQSTPNDDPSPRATQLAISHRLRLFLGSMDPGSYSMPELYNHFVLKYSYTSKERAEVEQMTRQQASSPDWHHLRNGRMTASEMHRIGSRLTTLKKDPTADPGALLRSLTTSSDLSHIPAIQWGVKHEPKARKRYFLVEKRRHRSLTIGESGLCISPVNPLFACSPDGIVHCKCKTSHGSRGNRWIVEIKCPAKGKDMPARQAAMKFCGVTPENTLDPKHKYFTQIQCQLGVLGLQMCDLIVFTKKGLHVTEVKADDQVFSEITQKTLEFGEQFLFGYLLTLV